MDRRQLLAALVSTTALAASSALAQTAGEPAFTPYQAPAFTQLVQSGATVVVHVHADWCPTCRAQLPALTSLMRDRTLANVRFVRVNFDTDRDFLTAHRVTSQSTILVFRERREVARLIGTTNAGELDQAIRRAAA